MSELLCEILGVINQNGNEYFSIYSNAENKKYKIPIRQLSKYNVQIGQKHYFRKEHNLQLNKDFLYYSGSEIGHNQYYKAGETYEFKIIDFRADVNKKGEPITIISVEDNDKNIITIRGLKWQKSEIWKFGTLKCEVQRINGNGVPRLINNDFRHPFYEINEEYDFKIVSKKTKETDKGEFHVFVLMGQDDCLHNVNMLPGQDLVTNNNETIRCKVREIKYHLRLSQTMRDPFFVTFAQIENSTYLENKYFGCFLNERDNSNNEIAQLVDQYNSKSAFWVFTYANKILDALFRNYIERRDYKHAKEVNGLIITFENWIITKGIIRSFTAAEIKSNTKTRAKAALESAKIKDMVLAKLCNSDYDFEIDNLVSRNDINFFEKVYYLIYFSGNESLNDDRLFKQIIEVIQSVDIKSTNELYFLDRLSKRISYNKNVFMSEEEKEYFSLSTSSIKANKFSDSEIKYIRWSYVEILIAQKLLMKEHLNILNGQLLKLFTKSIHEFEKKERLLFSAYKYLDNYTSQELPLPFIYNEKLELDFHVLEIIASNGDSNTNDNWNSLENFLATKNAFSVRLTKKSSTGYEVAYENLKGFLPYDHIKERKIKDYPFEQCDFTIDANCLAISRHFNFFVIGQVGYSYKNNLAFEIGNLYEAYVKNIVDYGLFLSTSSGEGLLHVSAIFDFEWDIRDINKYFKIGQQIKVLLFEVNRDNKPSFNFFQLKTLDPLYYNNYIENLFDRNASNFIEAQKEVELDRYFERALHEKAFCIEQFAVLQLDLSKKLEHFYIAKQFYTKAKNARSFLINIYISYFEILLKIKETIQSNSLVKIPKIKADAIETKNKVNQKTIETFPDSDKLVFFMDIVSMFNEKDEKTFDQLFNYIKSYSHETEHKDLRTIAKITLANNLLISESKEDSDFILKNLRLIFNYLSNGILSLEESIEDKNARELKEEILYWREKIKEDEGETLEFKSSFYTPILDENALKRAEYLKNLEKKTDKTNYEIRKLCGDLAPKLIIHSALKTLVAFANSSGGTLLIGVDNNKNILGLEQEYQSLSTKSRDGYGLYFDEMVRNYIGDSFSSLMNRRFVKFPEGDILIVKVEQSINEVFLLRDAEGKPFEQLYIRNLSSSKELIGSELAKFIRNRHIAQFTKTTTWPVN